HDWEMPRHRIGDRERRDDRDHEHRRRDEDADALARGDIRRQDRRHQRQEQRRPRVRQEEQHQWPEIEHEVEERIELRFLLSIHDGHSRPAMARAKSLAWNGARSSIPSPTPMKCTGRPNFAAIATRMPPRAVPSSLVMTSPVTPAMLRNTST